MTTLRELESTPQGRNGRICASRRHIASRAVLAASLVLGAAAMAPLLAAQPPGLTTTVTGVVTLVWGDGSRENPNSIGPIATLTDDTGNSVELVLDEATLKGVGGILSLNRRRVTVAGLWTPTVSGQGAALAVTDIQFADGQGPQAPEAVTGAQPWVSIMCKFSDVAAEPRNLTYFENMYSSAYPGIDHFWRQVSYDNVNVVGSDAFGWYTLPYPKSHYVVSNNPDLNAMFADCTAVADPYVYFPSFVGINLMFNDTFGCCAWGGGHWATLDGVSKVWRVTWEPPWGYSYNSVISHEMGHGFGLPHSSFNRSNVYDNCWDVMSDTYDCNIYDPTYGYLGQHTISYHKDLLGWFRAPEKLTLGVGQSTSVTLERLATPGWPIAKMVEVPTSGSSSVFYTVEARKRVAYDAELPGDAVIVHQVDLGQGIPAVVMGTDGGAGAMWTVGELFRDEANGIGMTVTSATTGGFTVAVGNSTPLAASFPAVDAHTGTGTSSNLNGVLEPGETVQVETGWTNVSTGSLSPTGSATFTGPAGATYSLPDSSASYGTIASTATSNCQSAGNCYVVGVSNPATRPALHWDATLTENLSTGGSEQWALHVGRSFSDVPTGAFGYSFIETLLHHGITDGCGGGKYCPGSTITRGQMAVFVATGLAGQNVPASGTVEGMGSYNCTGGGTSLFSDVAPTDAGCKFIHYIAAKKVTVGCGGGKFCPSSTVTRWQMAVFLATAMAGTYVPTSGTVPGKGAYNCKATGGTSVFVDVPASDAGCPFIHYLAATGVTAGCGANTYCPSAGMPRNQMAVFVSGAFGYSLYGP